MAIIMKTTASGTIRYDTRCYFNTYSKVSLIYHVEPKTEKKTDKLRSISKQSEKSTKSVLKKKRKAAVGRIFAEKEGLKPGMKEWGDCT